MENFTPVSALIGGLLIGAGAAMLLWLNGRVAGISGILGGLFSRTSSDAVWRLAFLIGLVCAPLLYHGLTGEPLDITIDTSAAGLVAAGLLVGFGTRLGGGCTSGHGVCGISRLSGRSIVATLVFMGTGMATVVVMRHLL